MKLTIYIYIACVCYVSYIYVYVYMYMFNYSNRFFKNLYKFLANIDWKRDMSCLTDMPKQLPNSKVSLCLISSNKAWALLHSFGFCALTYAFHLVHCASQIVLVKCFFPLLLSWCLQFQTDGIHCFGFSVFTYYIHRTTYYCLLFIPPSLWLLSVVSI